MFATFYYLIRNHYADFTGRARRREYWHFFGVAALLYVSIGSLGFWFMWQRMSRGIMPDAVSLFYPLIPLMIMVLLILLPSLSVAIRRLHDIGKSGKWLIPAIVLSLAGVFFKHYALTIVRVGYSLFLLYWYTLDSQPGDNQWGPNPKGIGNANSDDELIESIGQ